MSGDDRYSFKVTTPEEYAALGDMPELTQDERIRLARLSVRDMVDDLAEFGFTQREVKWLLHGISKGPDTATAPDIDADLMVGRSWCEVGLQAVLEGAEPDPPSLLSRTDETCLLYPGRVHWFQGEPESLKSWCAQLAVKQAINAGQKVLYIDYEDDERAVVGRLLALGATSECIRWNLCYVRPHEPLMGDARKQVYAAGWIHFNDTLDIGGKGYPFALAVIDGVTEAMALEGLDSNLNTDIAVWQALLPRKIACRENTAVIVIDHVTKSREGRGRFAIGGQHKLAGIDGAAYGFELSRPLSRALVEPVEGRATITVHKDRPGWVRSHARDGIVGTLELVAYPDGGVTGQIAAPDSINTAPPADLRAGILDYVRTYDGAAKSAIEASIGGNAAVVRMALKWLADHSQLEVRKEGNAHRHYLTKAGADALAEMEET
jgi:hypothetical protein